MTEMNFEKVAGLREEMEELVDGYNLLHRIYFDVVLMGNIMNGEYVLTDDLVEELEKYFKNKSTSPMI